MKKSFLLYLSLVVSMAYVGTATATSVFSDVSENHKNKIAIEYLKDQGVIQGYGDGTFKPNNTVNRAELLKILIEGQGLELDETTNQNCFPDISDEWFVKYVCYAKEKGWVEGYPDGTFQPAKTVNKVEALKMMIYSQGFEPELAESVEEDMFSDTDKTAWYSPYLKVAKDKNLLEENGKYFYPTNGMTRAGISENIFRIMLIRKFDEIQFSDEFVDLLNKEETELEDDEERGIVARVIDGDTVELENEERVRLIGIDTPELSGSDCYATESKEYLEGLIVGKEVRLEKDSQNDDKDKYDRLLRYVYIGDREAEILVNKKMLEDGYAYYYDSYKFEKMAEFENAEKAARDAGKALWEACEQPKDDSVGVVIHYVFYDGIIPEVESDEYVEIKNEGTKIVDLKGYTIKGSKGDENYVFPTLELEKGKTVKVYTNQGDYSFNNEKAIWNNSGETVYLYDADKNLIDKYEY
ncbi:S-layer homology domain-containing protein [Candidatus Peregrinibacteria bacterium]|nr:S-layer homology domain-containing protein [Candidatus Peregrinibacteria bacterium]